MKQTATRPGMRRLCVLCLSVILIFLLAVPALAAETAEAADLRLERAEGTVELQNANGRPVSAREGMKLYSGYTVATQASSYAYITLDSTKVVKLDANSEVEIRKQGDKLEVLVKSGALFFNVKAPVASGESLNVRTSTMVTGIRGTSGYVRVLDAKRSLITVLDGSVEVTTPDTADYDSYETVTVAAGMTGIATDHVSDEYWQVYFEGLKKEDIPGYVLVELAADADLCQRVQEDTGFVLEELTANAQERLLADQQASQEAQAAVEQAAAEMGNGEVSSAPPFQEKRPVQQTGGTASGEPAASGGAPSGGAATPAPATGSITLMKLLQDAGGSALTADGEKTYKFILTDASGSTQEVTVSVSASASQSSSVVISGLPLGSYTITETAPDSTDTVVSNGINYGYTSASQGVTVTIAEGSLDHTATITNTYTKATSFTITTAVGGAEFAKYLDNYANVTIASGGSATIESGVTANVLSGNTLTVDAGGVLTNNGIFGNRGTMVNDGTITNNFSFGNLASFENNGTIVNTVTASGESLFNNSQFTNNGQIDNTGKLDNLNSMTNEGTITNSGTLLNTNGGTLSNTNSIDNTGTLTTMANADISNSGGGTITNGGDIKVYGTLTNGDQGTIKNQSGGAIAVHKNSSSAQGLLTNASGGTIVNEGRVNVRTDSTLDNAGTVDNTSGNIYYDQGGEVSGQPVQGNQPEALT